MAIQVPRIYIENARILIENARISMEMADFGYCLLLQKRPFQFSRNSQQPQHENPDRIAARFPTTSLTDSCRKHRPTPQAASSRQAPSPPPPPLPSNPSTMCFPQRPRSDFVVVFVTPGRRQPGERWSDHDQRRRPRPEPVRSSSQSLCLLTHFSASFPLDSPIFTHFYSFYSFIYSFWRSIYPNRGKLYNPQQKTGPAVRLYIEFLLSFCWFSVSQYAFVSVCPHRCALMSRRPLRRR